MVRNYKRKTSRSQNIDPNIMKMAVEEVRSGQSLRKAAAAAFGFNFKTVANYCKKYRPNPLEERASVRNETSLTVHSTLQLETQDSGSSEKVDEGTGPSESLEVNNV